MRLSYLVLKEYVTTDGSNALCEFRQNEYEIVKRGDEVWITSTLGIFIVPWSSVRVAVPAAGKK